MENCTYCHLMQKCNIQQKEVVDSSSLKSLVLSNISCWVGNSSNVHNLMTWLMFPPSFLTFICCTFSFCLWYAFSKQSLYFLHHCALRVSDSWNEIIYCLLLHVLPFVSVWGVLSHMNAYMIAGSSYIGETLLSFVPCSECKETASSEGRPVGKENEVCERE